MATTVIQDSTFEQLGDVPGDLIVGDRCFVQIRGSVAGNLAVGQGSLVDIVGDLQEDVRVSTGPGSLVHQVSCETDESKSARVCLAQNGRTLITHLFDGFWRTAMPELFTRHHSKLSQQFRTVCVGRAFIAKQHWHAMLADHLNERFDVVQSELEWAQRFKYGDKTLAFIQLDRRLWF